MQLMMTASMPSRSASMIRATVSGVAGDSSEIGLDRGPPMVELDVAELGVGPDDVQ